LCGAPGENHEPPPKKMTSCPSITIDTSRIQLYTLAIDVICSSDKKQQGVSHGIDVLGSGPVRVRGHQSPVQAE
jgi:hypothetical protein